MCVCLFLIKSPDKIKAVRSSCCPLPPTPTTSWFKKKSHTHVCLFKTKRKRVSQPLPFFLHQHHSICRKQLPCWGLFLVVNYFIYCHFFCNYFEHNEWANLKNKLFFRTSLTDYFEPLNMFLDIGRVDIAGVIHHNNSLSTFNKAFEIGFSFFFPRVVCISS